MTQSNATASLSSKIQQPQKTDEKTISLEDSSDHLFSDDDIQYIPDFSNNHEHYHDFRHLAQFTFRFSHFNNNLDAFNQIIEELITRLGSKCYFVEHGQDYYPIPGSLNWELLSPPTKEKKVISPHYNPQSDFLYSLYTLLPISLAPVKSFTAGAPIGPVLKIDEYTQISRKFQETCSISFVKETISSVNTMFTPDIIQLTNFNINFLPISSHCIHTHRKNPSSSSHSSHSTREYYTYGNTHNNLENQLHPLLDHVCLPLPEFYPCTFQRNRQDDCPAFWSRCQQLFDLETKQFGTFCSAVYEFVPPVLSKTATFVLFFTISIILCLYGVYIFVEKQSSGYIDDYLLNLSPRHDNIQTTPHNFVLMLIVTTVHIVMKKIQTVLSKTDTAVENLKKKYDDHPVDSYQDHPPLNQQEHCGSHHARKNTDDSFDGFGDNCVHTSMVTSSLFSPPESYVVHNQDVFVINNQHSFNNNNFNPSPPPQYSASDKL